MKSILGPGKIKLGRTINGTLVEAEFNHFDAKEMEIILDIRNKNKYNRNGTSLQDIKGCWLGFTLELVTFPSAQGGSDGDNMITLFQILSNLVQQTDKSSQTITLKPAENTQYSGFSLDCLIDTDKISIKDTATHGKGQSITLKLKTQIRNRTFLGSLPVYDHDPAVNAGWGITQWDDAAWGA
jgi:hypothetical protein